MDNRRCSQVRESDERLPEGARRRRIERGERAHRRRFPERCPSCVAAGWRFASSKPTGKPGRDALNKHQNVRRTPRAHELRDPGSLDAKNGVHGFIPPCRHSTGHATGSSPGNRPGSGGTSARPGIVACTRAQAPIFDGELLSRLEHLVTEGAGTAQPGLAAQRPAVVSRSPSPVEQMGVPHGEHGDTDMARQLAQLQRTVSELAATISAQAMHIRDESQAQGRERMTPPQRTVVVQRVDASSTTPGAFWERSRLGRLHLRTGR